MSASSASCRFPSAAGGVCWQSLGEEPGPGEFWPLEKGQCWQAHTAGGATLELCHPVTLPSLPGGQGEVPRLDGISRQCYCDAKGLFSFLPGTMGSDHGVPVPVRVPGHAGTWQSVLMSLAVPQGSVPFPGWLLSLPLCPAALPRHPPHPGLGFRLIQISFSCKEHF